MQELTILNSLQLKDIDGSRLFMGKKGWCIGLRLLRIAYASQRGVEMTSGQVVL